MPRKKASATSSFAWSKEESGHSSALVKSPLSEDWQVSVAFANREGKASVESIYIEPTSDPPRDALTTRLLRRIRLGELLAQAQAQVPSGAGEHFQFLAQTPRRGRRRLISDLELAGLAVAYEAACTTSAAQPRLVLAKERKESPGRVRDLIHEARRRGLLSPAVPGKAGGTATAEARRLLAESQKSANRGGEQRRNRKKKR
jgi:hypothetical protein